MVLVLVWMDNKTSDRTFAQLTYKTSKGCEDYAAGMTLASYATLCVSENNPPMGSDSHA